MDNIAIFAALPYGSVFIIGGQTYMVIENPDNPRMNAVSLNTGKLHKILASTTVITFTETTIMTGAESNNIIAQT